MPYYPSDEIKEMWERPYRLDAENKPFLEQLEAIENFFHPKSGYKNAKRLADHCSFDLQDIRKSLCSIITRLSIPTAELAFVDPEYAEALEKVTQAMRLINDASKLIVSADDKYLTQKSDEENTR